MPGAGLYLPDTLSKSLDRTEAHTVRPRHRERKASQDSDSERKSMASTRMSSENVTKVFSSLPTVFDFADWLSTQGRLSSDNEVLIDLLQRVRHDFTEASRLYTSQAVVSYLESWPDKKTYIDKILHDIEKALNDIGQFLETVRVFGDDGSTLSLRRKFQWAHSHQKKLGSKQQLLTTCHQSLMPAVQLMQTAEMNATFDPIHEMPGRPWVEDTASDILKSPHSRHKSRFSQKNWSVPSITLSESDLKDDQLGMKAVTQCSLNADVTLAQPYQHVLAELPGSTPDDIHRPSAVPLADSPMSRGNSMEGVLQKSSGKSNTHSLPENDMFQEIQRPTTEDVCVVAAPRGRIPDPTSTRRSVDHVRPSLSFFDDRARASFDSARPRANSEQMRPRRSFEMRSRPSNDQVRPLPTLSERPIERFNSTASVAVGDAISIPLTHMRYQTRHINVRKPPVKHNSLPSTLPSFPSQTSLMDDLSTWVMPQSARESYRSAQSLNTTASISDTTSVTSVTSSPAVPNSPVSCTPVPFSTTIDLPLPLSEPATEPQLKEGSVEPSPFLTYIPVLPSRPAPAPPSSSPAPPIPPKIPLSHHHTPVTMPQSRLNQSLQRIIPPIPSSPPSETGVIPYSRSNESLQRAPSDPIPPPYVRRRRPVPSPNRNRLIEQTSKALSASTPSSIDTASTNVGSHYAATPNVTEQSGNTVEEQQSSSEAHPSTGFQPSYRIKQSINHTASNATTMDKYTIPMVPSNPPPILDSPALSSPQFSDSISTATSHSHTKIHSTFSNASATDKYPIAVSLDSPPSIPVASTQSLPIMTSRTAFQNDVRHVKSNASATDKYPIAVSPTSPPPVPSLPLDSPPTSTTSSQTSNSGTAPSQPSTRPMTALAKRRAAHAKRMQMAFGPDSENT